MSGNYLILGAGAQGHIIAHDRLQDTTTKRVTVLDMHEGNLKNLVTQLNDSRVNSQLIDISNENIELGLAYINDEDYLEVIHMLVTKKLNDLNRESNPLVKKKKLIDSIVRKGFEPYLVTKSYNEVILYS